MDSANHRKIFIGGLSYNTDDDKLRDYFAKYGTVEDAVVMKDPVTKRSRGFGFITFTKASDVDNVLSYDTHLIDSRKVEAKRAVPRIEGNSKDSPVAPASPTKTTSHFVNTSHSNINNPSANQQTVSSPTSDKGSSTLGDECAHCKIFVGGLHYETRDAEFRSYFEKYGRVLSSEVMFNRETHKSRGFGFIVFDNEDSVDAVCADEHEISGKVVEVKRAVPRLKYPNNKPPTINSKDATPTSSPRGDKNVPSPTELKKISTPTASSQPKIVGSAAATLNSTMRKVAVASSGTSYAAALKAGVGNTMLSPSMNPTSPSLSEGLNQHLQYNQEHILSPKLSLPQSSFSNEQQHGNLNLQLPPSSFSQHGMLFQNDDVLSRTRPQRAHSESFLVFPNRYNSSNIQPLPPGTLINNSVFPPGVLGGSQFGSQSLFEQNNGGNHNGNYRIEGGGMVEQSQSHSPFDNHQSQNNTWNSQSNDVSNDLFSFNRSDIERSVSLGGWVPSSSFSGQGQQGYNNNGYNFGNNGNNHNNLYRSNNLMPPPPGHNMMQQQQQQGQFNVPSAASWASFVDPSSNSQNQGYVDQMVSRSGSGGIITPTRQHSGSDIGMSPYGGGGRSRPVENVMNINDNMRFLPPSAGQQQIYSPPTMLQQPQSRHSSLGSIDELGVSYMPIDNNMGLPPPPQYHQHQQSPFGQQQHQHQQPPYGHQSPFGQQQQQQQQQQFHQHQQAYDFRMQQQGNLDYHQINNNQGQWPPSNL